jgi:hypothetical protein
MWSNFSPRQVESSWNVMAHGDPWEGKWRGNWRIERVTSTLHATSEHGVSGITTADMHTSTPSSRLNWRPRRFKWTRPFRRKREIWFLRVCLHISNAVYHCGDETKNNEMVGARGVHQRERKCKQEFCEETWRTETALRTQDLTER